LNFIGFPIPNFLKVTRVQKYVEKLDMLKVKNSMTNDNDVHAPKQSPQKHSNGKRLEPIQEQPQQIHSNGYHGPIVPIQEQQKEQSRSNSNELSLVFEEQQNQPSGVVVTTKWETFDSTPPLITFPSTSTTTTPSMTNNNNNTNNNSGPSKFSWEFFM
jgi:hypothetical protein